jgi:hypothetical protein
MRARAQTAAFGRTYTYPQTLHLSANIIRLSIAVARGKLKAFQMRSGCATTGGDR